MAGHVALLAVGPSPAVGPVEAAMLTLREPELPAPALTLSGMSPLGEAGPPALGGLMGPVADGAWPAAPREQWLAGSLVQTEGWPGREQARSCVGELLAGGAWRWAGGPLKTAPD